MGIKVNANPGVITTASVTPDKIGTYNIRCTEICGLNHAFMMTKVHVMSDTDFQKWLASQPTRI
jgi:cytochrome c oxidase subunit 2